MSKFSRKTGKIVKTWVEFDRELFYEVRHRNYNVIGQEKVRLKKELKKLPQINRTQRVCEIEERLAEIEGYYSLQKELARQFAPVWYVVVDGRMKAFSYKTEARRVSGLPDDTAFDVTPVEGSPISMIEKGTTTGTATRQQIEKATTIGRNGTLYKNCSTCGDELPYKDFNKHATAIDGRQSKCKNCALTYSKNWHEGNAKKKDT